MPAQDDEFIRQLRATFQVEAQEHLQTISSVLLALENTPSSADEGIAIETVYRAAHSLKGAARAVDFSDIETVCQALEGLFSLCKQGHTGLSTEAFDTLHDAFDTINGLLNSEQMPSQKPLGELVRRITDIRPRPPANSGSSNAEHPALDTSRSSIPVESSFPPRLSSIPSGLSTASLPEAEKVSPSDTVRISMAKLDSRLMQAEDMLTLKAMTARRASDLRDLKASLEHWRKEWAKIASEARELRQAVEQKDAGDKSKHQISRGLVGFLDWNRDYFRTLENKMQMLAAQVSQDHRSVEKRVDDLLEDSKKLLMLPFSTIANLMPKIVRDLCRDQEKQARLVIQGDEVEIDKRILEEMKDALIHILRNSMDHGVEKPEERARLHKPAQATIRIAVSSINGNKVEILVADDGAGVDLMRVKDSAVRQGIITQTAARTLSDEEILGLTFHSDVTSNATVTAISGRGLGMAIVRDKAERLGGRVFLESQSHVGTTLRIVLPLTLATFRGVLVTLGDRIFVLPTVSIERVIRVRAADIQTIENRETVSLEGRAVSLARLAGVLELPTAPPRVNPTAYVNVVVLQSIGQRIAFEVDSILHEEEVLVKALRKPLIRVRNIAGATVLGSGRLAPILNVIDLMKSARTHGAAPAPSALPVQISSDPDALKKAAKKVLVVEDSITSRMLLKGILESAGFNVRTAVDGMDAFTLLREDTFDLVVSDVEMPRLNGIDLTARIRLDKRLAELPVVLVTALELREERERGIDAGADAYVVKSTFDQSNLLEVVRRLL